MAPPLSSPPVGFQARALVANGSLAVEGLGPGGGDIQLNERGLSYTEASEAQPLLLDFNDELFSVST